MTTQPSHLNGTPPTETGYTQEDIDALTGAGESLAWEDMDAEQQFTFLLHEAPLSSWHTEGAKVLLAQYRHNAEAWGRISTLYRERYGRTKELEAAIDAYIARAQPEPHASNGQSPPRAHTPIPPVGDEDYPYSDAFNAHRLIQAHRHEMRYCPAWKTWLTWTGTHWQRDTDGLLERWQREPVMSLGAQLPTLGDNAAKALLAHIKGSLSTSRLKSAVEQAHTWEGMCLPPSTFDTHPWLLNCRNGTLDLRTGELCEHAAADFLTKCLPIAYDPIAECPTWEQFLKKVLATNAELLLFVQKGFP